MFTTSIIGSVGRSALYLGPLFGALAGWLRLASRPKFAASAWPAPTMHRCAWHWACTLTFIVAAFAHKTAVPSDPARAISVVRIAAVRSISLPLLHRTAKGRLG
jgi:hypothetical protein